MIVSESASAVCWLVMALVTHSPGLLLAMTSPIRIQADGWRLWCGRVTPNAKTDCGQRSMWHR
jgi:hypothetical protein